MRPDTFSLRTGDSVRVKSNGALGMVQTRVFGWNAQLAGYWVAVGDALHLFSRSDLELIKTALIPSELAATVAYEILDALRGGHQFSESVAAWAEFQVAVAEAPDDLKER